MTNFPKITDRPSKIIQIDNCYKIHDVDPITNTIIYEDIVRNIFIKEIDKDRKAIRTSANCRFEALDFKKNIWIESDEFYEIFDIHGTHIKTIKNHHSLIIKHMSKFSNQFTAISTGAMVYCLFDPLSYQIEIRKVLQVPRYCYTWFCNREIYCYISTNTEGSSQLVLKYIKTDKVVLVQKASYAAYMGAGYILLKREYGDYCIFLNNTVLEINLKENEIDFYRSLKITPVRSDQVIFWSIDCNKVNIY